MKKINIREIGGILENADFEETLKDKKVNKNGILTPIQPIKTIKGLIKFHLHLFELCITYELKRKSIEASIKKLREWRHKIVPLLQEHKEPTKMLLNKIKEQIEFEEERLKVVKDEIKLIYRTNELLIENVMLTRKGDLERTKLMKQKTRGTAPDLLHGGGKGWMFEYEMVKELHSMGMLAFLTFGTFLDPLKIDLIATSTPLTPIKFRKFLNGNQVK